MNAKGEAAVHHCLWSWYYGNRNSTLLHKI